ncbi:MAG TPA: c-type cytochrome, partial [Pyrinomonadaceae bacterium]
MTKRVVRHGVVSLVIGLAFGFALANRVATRAGAEGKGGDSPSTALLLGGKHLFSQEAQGDKPVEQTRKNIKVLTGLKESQLFPVMNFFNASLGVRCDFCHVQNGNEFDWPNDAKQEKKTAREMIKMTMEANKTAFGGNNAVTCFTCHRGQPQVVGLPTLPLPPPPPRRAEAAASPAPSPSSSPSASPAAGPAANALPTAEQVFDKYIQALGGSAAIEKLKTRVMKGTYVAASGVEMPYEVYQA